MPILFSKEFGVPKQELKTRGVFDVLLNKDSSFFINLKRLKVTNIPEFVGSYENINQFFNSIGLLLQRSKPGDKLYNTALKKFHFPEVNGINLGFAVGKHGAGFGEKLRKQIIKDAYDIIQSGSIQPEIFHLVSLFEDDVGPDRISDMIARLVYDNIRNYSRRIYRELNITAKKYPSYKFVDGIVINPYKGEELLLLPIDILHKLPIANGWDDIDRVCRENEEFRNQINELIGDEWEKLAISEKKKYVRDWIFKNPTRLKRVVTEYQNSTVDMYELLSNLDYMVDCLRSEHPVPNRTFNNSKEIALFVLNDYKEWVELHRGSFVVNGTGIKADEKTIQRTLHGIAFRYCREKNFDISPEVDSGRGPVDFKISHGNDKTAIEIKLTSNPKCVHGYEVQIEEYAKSENTENKLFVIVDTGKYSSRIQDVYNKQSAMLSQGKVPAEIIVIDAKPKDSASIYNP